MRKFAAHRLYLSATEMVPGPVVVQLTSEGLVAGYEILSAEQPAVEWLGGVFLLLPVSETPASGAENFKSWYGSVCPAYHPECGSYALWHVSGIPVDAGLAAIPSTAPHRLG